MGTSKEGTRHGSTMTFFLGCRKFWSISLPIASVVTVADCIPSFLGYNKNISIRVWRGTSTKSHKSNNARIVMTGTALDAFWLQLSIFSMEMIMKQMPGYPTFSVACRWQKHLHNSPQYEAPTKTSRIIYNKYCQHIVILWYTDYKTTFPKITSIFPIFSGRLLGLFLGSGTHRAFPYPIFDVTNSTNSTSPTSKLPGETSCSGYRADASLVTADWPRNLQRPRWSYRRAEWPGIRNTVNGQNPKQPPRMMIKTHYL